MRVDTYLVSAAWAVTAVQLYFVASSRAKLLKKMKLYGVKPDEPGLISRLAYSMTMMVTVAAWLWVAIDSRSAHAEWERLMEKVDEANQLNERAASCDRDLRKAAVAVSAVKAKIDHQSRRDTVAISAQYHLDYTFDIDPDSDDWRFHSFCDEHVDDALWFSDRETPAFRSERAKLMGYNGAPDKKGGFEMECRWSVIANRKEWCRNAYSPK